MSWFIGEEHQRDIATSMASPPYLRSAVFFDKQVFLAPEPIVRNPAVATVKAEMNDVKPGSELLSDECV